MVTSQKPAAPVATPNAKSKQPSVPIAPPRASEEEIRDYAKHLFVQGGSVIGHDDDNWLEAEACLSANIPKESSRTRMHHHTQITDRAALPLVKHGKS